MKKVHEQLKALSSNPGSKKKRKSVMADLDVLDGDPLFLPPSLAIDSNSISKKKMKKASKNSSTPTSGKKASKNRSTPAAAPPPKKASSK